MTKKNINLGDKLLCKKDLFQNLISDDKLIIFSHFIKDKYYSIVDIKIIDDKYAYKNTCDHIFGQDDYIYYINGEMNKSCSFWSESFFHDYFYEKKELRNKKLQKING